MENNVEIENKKIILRQKITKNNLEMEDSLEMKNNHQIENKKSILEMENKKN